MLAVAVPAVVFVAGSHAAKLFSASGVYCDRRMMSPMKVFFSVFVIYAALVVFNRFDTPDTTWQWGQAVGERPLDDWHPLIHTFLVFLPTVVVKSGWFVAVAQSFAFAALVAWTYSALMKYGYNGRAVAIVLIISVFNPFSMAMACVLWKDTAFAYTGLALTVCLVHIVETDGDWLTGKRRSAWRRCCFWLRSSGITVSSTRFRWLCFCPFPSALRMWRRRWSALAWRQRCQ
jgi:hypothetical protein